MDKSTLACRGLLLLSAFESDLLDRIAKTAGMKRLRAEIARLDGIIENTKQWMQLQGLDSDEFFKLYYNPRLYRKTKSSVPVKMLPIVRGSVSAAMDVTNYTGDVLGSEIADHTFAQDCAWRRRMHAANSRANDIEKILAAPPAPLSRFTTKKRKRATSASKKRARKQSKTSKK